MAAHPDWVRDGKINFLFQTGTKDIPGAPPMVRLREKVTDPVDKQALEFLLAREPLGRPFLAPPGVPPERVKILREAFLATLRDPAFLEDAERTKTEVNPVSGEEVDAILSAAVNSPPAVIDRVKKILDR